MLPSPSQGLFISLCRRVVFRKRRWPEDARKVGDPKGNLSADGRKPKDLEWLSPILQFDPTLNPGHLSVR